MEPLEQRIQRAICEEIAIQPYDAAWPDRFRLERQHLLDCLPNELICRIEHIGSTAVPGLAAKPIVDILVGVTGLAETKTQIVPVLRGQGYEYFWRPTIGDDGPPWYAWFIKRDSQTGDRTHHVHMVEQTQEFEGHWDRLLFRDYLVAHPDLAGQYEQLKQRLASEYPNDRVQYTQQKAEFVLRVTECAKR